MVAGQRHMWGGSVYAVALLNPNVGLFAGGSSVMKEPYYRVMKKPYTVYRMEQVGNYCFARIEAETPEGKQQGIADYLREYRVYDARVDHETGTTAVMKRWYKQ